jgi:hypothetical protein
MPTHSQLTTAAIALIAFAIVAAVQRNGFAIPIVGEYLPQ